MPFFDAMLTIPVSKHGGDKFYSKHGIASQTKKTYRSMYVIYNKILTLLVFE